jgi:hypothetical protein
MADAKLKALKAYLAEAADSYLAGQSDELAALAESAFPEKGLIDRPGFGERFGRNLERRQEARKQTQDENIVAGGLGSMTGTVLSPAARILSLPARMTTSAVEEVGRSDPSTGLEYLKALALGAGQGAAQQFAPNVAASFRKKSWMRKLPVILDATESNAAPGLERKIEADRLRREEEQRLANQAR